VIGCHKCAENRWFELLHGERVIVIVVVKDVIIAYKYNESSGGIVLVNIAF